MEEKDILTVWRQYGAQLQANMALNQTILREIQLKKVQKPLNTLLYRRIGEGLIFLLLFLGSLQFVGHTYPTLHFVVAGLVLNIIFAVGLIGNLVEIVMIRQLDYSIPILTFQAQLNKLKAYNLQLFRWAFLTVPLYGVYLIVGAKLFFGVDMIEIASTQWLWANLVFSLLLIPVSVLFFRALRYDNPASWVKSLIRDNGGKEIHAAIEFLGEIEEFKQSS